MLMGIRPGFVSAHTEKCKHKKPSTPKSGGQRKSLGSQRIFTEVYKQLGKRGYYLRARYTLSSSYRRKFGRQAGRPKIHIMKPCFPYNFVKLNRLVTEEDHLRGVSK